MKVGSYITGLQTEYKQNGTLSLYIENSAGRAATTTHDPFFFKHLSAVTAASSVQKVKWGYNSEGTEWSALIPFAASLSMALAALPGASQLYLSRRSFG